MIFWLCNEKKHLIWWTL